jgi:hypothetical protein
MKEHPRHKENESKKMSVKKGYKFLFDYALPSAFGTITRSTYNDQPSRR